MNKKNKIRIICSIFLIIVVAITVFMVRENNTNNKIENVTNEYIGAGRSTKAIRKWGKEINDNFTVGDYNVCIKSLAFDSGTKKGFCEMIVTNADGSDKEIITSNSSFGNIYYGLDGLGGVGDLDKKISDGKVSLVFEIEDTSHTEVTDNIVIGFNINGWGNRCYDYLLNDTDGVVAYIECGDTNIYVCETCVKIIGKKREDIIPVELELIYQNNAVKSIFKKGECLVNSRHSSIGEEVAIAIFDYKSNEDFTKLCKVRYNGKVYEVKREEVN